MSATTTRNRLARIFFWPVYFFIEKVRFARSFLLLLLLLPDFYVAYLLVQQTTKDVEFSAKESDGVAYITPARAFLADVQQLRVASALPDFHGSAEQARLISEGDRLALEVDKVQEAYGAELRTTDAWKKAKELWTSAKAGMLAGPGAPGEDLSKLTGLLATEIIINTAGNNSNLILDPDLDSYWLMDAFVFKLPALGELAAAVGADGIRMASDGKMEIAERMQLAATSGLITTTASDLINIDLKNALDDNENRKGASNDLRKVIEKPFTDTVREIEAFTALVHARMLLPDAPDIDRRQLAAAAKQVIESIHDLQKVVGPELDRLCLDRVDRYEHTRLVGIITFFIAALLISYVFNGFTSSVRERQEVIIEENRQLQGDILGLLQVVSSAADGDLTVRAKVGDGTLGNVADAFNQMMESWQQLVAAIITQLDRTGKAVAELRASAGTMAGGASRQAQEVFAATTSVQRMSDEIHRVSGTAESAAAAALRTQESAQQGSDSVQNVVIGMESLRALVQAGAKKIKTLGDRSMEINSIVGTITKISEQTNMLALNAAIEAARAGEQGRGFSVVADEVRKLAERTATATQEIEKLVRNIQVETTESVEAIERQTHVVEEEGKAVSQAGNALTRIQDMSSQSSSLVTDIAGTARDQVQGAQLVVGTMQRISSIAKDTEATAQGSLSIAQELGELSEELRTSMGRFKVG